MSSTNGDPEVGARLKELRQRERLSQQAFADSLGVSVRTYQNYERGQRSVTKELLCALIDHYEIDASWLLAGNEGYPHHVPVSKVFDQERIDERVFMEAAEALAESKIQPDDPKEFSRYAAHIYNMVADEDDPVYRTKKIKGSIQLMELSQGLKTPESREDQPPSKDEGSSSVQQSISGNRHQVAGRDFQNHGEQGGRGGKR